MKKCFLLLLLCLTFCELYALPDLPAKTYSRQDTSLAIQHLFSSKRLTGRIYTLTGSCYLAGGVIALPVGAVGLVQTSFGLIRQTRFRRAQEEATLESYQAGIGLSKRIQRHLKAKYFG